MTKLTKQILLAFTIAALVIIVPIVAFVVGILYFTSDENYSRDYEVRKAEGREFGKLTDQQGCMQEGLKRARTMNILKINEITLNQAFVEECLKAGRPSPNFCDGVPSTATSTFTEWPENQCKKAGMDVVKTGCKAVFEEKVDFCNR
jgi:hypothetical protein